MYEHMLDRDLSELFMEYYKSDWKKRSEAAKILGHIKDPNAERHSHQDTSPYP